MGFFFLILRAFCFLVFGLWGWRLWFGDFLSFRFCDVVETNTMLITLMSSSNLTFSLAPGWSSVEYEDWRNDVRCAWLDCGGDVGMFFS